MVFLSRFCALALLLISLPALAHEGQAAEGQSARGLQYVIISFDGASFIEQWQRSRALAKRTGAHFTYFLSCVYLLTHETRDAYRAPGVKAARSNVGYGQSREEVRLRLDQIWQARDEGHEIASHGCGHFDGSAWSMADWKQEFGAFRTILRDAFKINGIAGEPEGWRAFAEGEIAGFRAPYLATNDSLFRVLAEEGMRYDASTVSSGPESPVESNGITRFSLPLIPEGPTKKRLIAMDYNLYVRHSDGKEQPSAAKLFEDRAYEAFLAAFEREYAGSRTPLQIGFHFTLMNDGAYWRALERFAETVCTREEVRCVGYREYLDRTAPGTAELRPSIGG